MSKGDVPPNAKLGWIRAILFSFWGRDAEFYPCVVDDGEIKSLTSAQILEEAGRSSSWSSLTTGKDLDDALALAKQSLAEVKAQTEYQDQKATRLLTITTFLTAFSGVLFTRFQDRIDLSQFWQLNEVNRWLVGASYVIFALFILAALAGALVIFHATRTRFKYPSTPTAQKQEGDPKSLEFYSALIGVRPRAWMNAWVTTTTDDKGVSQSVLRTDLKSRYFHDLVSETYLIAAKTADKLRYLEPGQLLLAASLRFLFVWLLLAGAATIFVPTTHAPTPPTHVRLVDMPKWWQHLGAPGAPAPAAPAKGPPASINPPKKP